MKIEWLNDEMTEAIVTRGWLWLKRRAHVERFEPEHTYDPRWRHVESKNVDSSVSWECECERDYVIEQRRLDGDWQPVRSLPKARVVP